MSNPPCKKCIVQAACQGRIHGGNTWLVSDLIESCIHIQNYLKVTNERFSHKRLSKFVRIFGFDIRHKNYGGYYLFRIEEE